MIKVFQPPNSNFKKACKRPKLKDAVTVVTVVAVVTVVIVVAVVIVVTVVTE
jgi:hypothetical protein